MAGRFPERLLQSWQNLRLLCGDLGDNHNGTRSFLPSDRNFGCTAVALLATKSEPARDHPAGSCLIWDEQGKYDFSPIQTYLFVKWYPPQQISLYYQSCLIIQVYLCMCRETKTMEMPSEPSEEEPHSTHSCEVQLWFHSAALWDSHQNEEIQAVPPGMGLTRLLCEVLRKKLHFNVQDKALCPRERNQFWKEVPSPGWALQLLHPWHSQAGNHWHSQRKAVRR